MNLFPFFVPANGLRIAFDVNTSLNISDVAFFPSQRFHSYDLYATAVDKEDVLFFDLHSGSFHFLWWITHKIFAPFSLFSAILNNLLFAFKSNMIYSDGFLLPLFFFAMQSIKCFTLQKHYPRFTTNVLTFSTLNNVIYYIQAMWSWCQGSVEPYKLHPGNEPSVQ